MPVIAVFSDVICPWCYVGKRRLERALAQLDLGHETSVGWLPFELNPDMPPEGIERSAYRARKFGAERSASLDAQMIAIGREEGIAFAFDRMRRTPNTRRAHMLIAHASGLERGDAMNEALFRAYFEEARDIGDPDILADIAEGIGLDRKAAAAAIEDGVLRGHVVALEEQASKMAISGVPFFIVDRAWAMSGAQSAEQWRTAFTARRSASRPQPAA